jgi:hypothetical protein
VIWIWLKWFSWLRGIIWIKIIILKSQFRRDAIVAVPAVVETLCAASVRVCSRSVPPPIAALHWGLFVLNTACSGCVGIRLYGEENEYWTPRHWVVEVYRCAATKPAGSRIEIKRFQYRRHAFDGY